MSAGDNHRVVLHVCGRVGRVCRALSTAVGMVARRGVGLVGCFRFLNAGCMSRRVRCVGCHDVAVPNDASLLVVVGGVGAGGAGGVGGVGGGTLLF